MASCPSISGLCENQGEVCYSFRSSTVTYPAHYMRAFAFSPFLYPPYHFPLLPQGYQTPGGTGRALLCNATPLGGGPAPPRPDAKTANGLVRRQDS